MQPGQCNGPVDELVRVEPASITRPPYDGSRQGSMSALGHPAGAPSLLAVPALKLDQRSAQVVEERQGHSACAKFCCCLVFFLFLGIVTVAALIAFLVRVPTVDYKSSTFSCPSGDPIVCATSTVQVDVILLVNNPNIIGATINAKLGLNEDAAQGGDFLGPGTIGDTHVGSRGKTELHALFTLDSLAGKDVLKTLFIDRRAVTLHLKGTVFFHLGALRPSHGFSTSFVVQPPDLSSLPGSLPSIIGKLAGIEKRASEPTSPDSSPAAPAAESAPSSAESTNPSSTHVQLHLDQRLTVPLDVEAFARALAAVAPNLSPSTRAIAPLSHTHRHLREILARPQ